MTDDIRFIDKGLFLLAFISWCLTAGFLGCMVFAAYEAVVGIMRAKK